jgi:hypothetical protein
MTLPAQRETILNLIKESVVAGARQKGLSHHWNKRKNIPTLVTVQ